MRKAIRALPLFICLVLLSAGQSQAQTWQSQAEPGVTRAVICPRDGRDGSGNFSCFMLECPTGGRARYAIAIAGTRFAAAFTAEVVIDGHAYPPLGFAQSPVDGYFLAYAQTRPDRDPALLEALGKGQRAEVILTQSGISVPFFSLPLDGAAEAIASVTSLCPVAQRDVTQTALGTPATNPARYAKPHEVGLRDNSTDLLARTILAPEIAEMGDEAAALEVTASLIRGSDGRQMLFTDLCHPSWFGTGGCELFVHVSPQAGGQLTKAAEVAGGTVVWIDQTVLVMGWPDLVMQATTGDSPPYARWRWNGQTYAFVESF